MPTSVLAVLTCGLALTLGFAAAGIIVKRRRGPLFAAATLMLVVCIASVVVLNAFATAIPPARNVPAPLPDTATLYYTSNDAPAPYLAQVYAVNARDGSMRWRHPLNGAIYNTTPVAQDRTVYVPLTAIGGDFGGIVVALRATDGGERWRVQYPASQIRSLFADAGAVYATVANADRASLVALRAADGAPLWDITIPSVVALKAGPSPVAAAGGVLYFSLDGTTLVAVRERDGEQLWQAQPAGITAPLAAMRADADNVYLLDSAGGVAALGAATGTVRWRFNSAPGDTYLNTSWLALSSGILYVEAVHPSPPSTSALYALRVLDGSVLWRRDVDSMGELPLLDGAALYVPSGGSLTVFRASDGTVVRSFNPGAITQMVALGGVIFGYTPAVTHPYGLFGVFQRGDPHSYLTALPATGDAPYWRVTAPTIEGSLALAT